tara:strand:- start:1077 stop:1235 length:159 start_codon:yes stop_codon:yes gene_type:complete
MKALYLADPEKLKNYSYFADLAYADSALVDEGPDGVLLAQASAEHAANVDMT